jgi:elongation factor P
MIEANNLRKGNTIEIKGVLYKVVDQKHVKPGKGPAFMRVTLKNMDTGSIFEEKFRTNEKFKKARVENKPAVYLYNDGDNYIFMDEETAEQYPVFEEDIGDNKKYIADSCEVTLVMYNGRPISIEVPSAVDLEVTETEPGVRGDTATGGSKPATLETGAVIQVPFFINNGDKVRVDTRKNEYIERVKE